MRDLSDGDEQAAWWREQAQLPLRQRDGLWWVNRALCVLGVVFLAALLVSALAGYY